MSSAEQYEGKLVEMIYQNDENGYRVGILECEEQVLTVVGILPGLNAGDRIRVRGKKQVHQRYGEQLKVEEYYPLLPESQEGMMEYLASGLIPGVGEVMARRMLETFGTDIFTIMQQEPERLQEVQGIGKKTWRPMAEAFQTHNQLRELILWLAEKGIESRFALRIHQAFGSGAKAIVETNPYQLLGSMPEIGFKAVDRMALKLGREPEDPQRVEAGILHTLAAASFEGHTYLPGEELLRRVCDGLRVEEGITRETIQSLAYDQRIQLTGGAEDQRVYLLSCFEAESDTCKKLLELACTVPLPAPENLKKRLEQSQKEQNIQLARAQIEGVEAAFHHRSLVITGGPGTGKTTLINSLIRLIEEEALDVLLAAPTGRAAKRMTETSGKEASTIHRLLEMGFSEETGEHYFGRDEENPLETDFLIIDEVSMVDILMMRHLLKAIGTSTTLILVGDVDQLPSVGPGAVLKDIINSGIIPVIRLTEIFRQAQESLIVMNAHRINEGEVPTLNHRDRDFFFMTEENPHKALEKIRQLLVKRLPDHYHFDPIKDIQLLTPTKKGITGTINLNQHLQQVLNPPEKDRQERAFGSKVFREGDKVMQIRNNYSLEWSRIDPLGMEETGRGVFNGDIGHIAAIQVEKELLTILFDDDRQVVYPFALVDELEPAYAITIHKSQGSEFPAVVLPMYPGPPVLMTRNLLYTAITRARSLVVLIGHKQVLYRMIQNNRTQERFSGLEERLKQVMEYMESPL
ncbi:SF1B family DNA helicase RecD2 [Tindallia californiensis]|uniref:ATP-dependent RecD2 DNA helicase n=1 Tax=Tindallia californiensis TaxID=159292 RepID=A0A1H3LD17_9FIRM|nr:ATP-dependent RecD-like DNA helicase [Tindallia californiensis]SDY62186.1 ATP-dependent DNA helicase, RecD/TraA family [Tindallia californiensis]